MNALACDMKRDCREAVTMIDEKGYAYCTNHGVQRKTSMRCRLLKAAEIAAIQRGEYIDY